MGRDVNLTQNVVVFPQVRAPQSDVGPSDDGGEWIRSPEELQKRRQAGLLSPNRRRGTEMHGHDAILRDGCVSVHAQGGDSDGALHTDGGLDAALAKLGKDGGLTATEAIKMAKKAKRDGNREGAKKASKDNDSVGQTKESLEEKIAKVQQSKDDVERLAREVREAQEAKEEAERLEREVREAKEAKEDVERLAREVREAKESKEEVDKLMAHEVRTVDESVVEAAEAEISKKIKKASRTKKDGGGDDEASDKKAKNAAAKKKRKKKRDKERRDRGFGVVK